jgi:hypothetical protein
MAFFGFGIKQSNTALSSMMKKLQAVGDVEPEAEQPQQQPQPQQQQQQQQQPQQQLQPTTAQTRAVTEIQSKNNLIV